MRTAETQEKRTAGTQGPENFRDPWAGEPRDPRDWDSWDLWVRWLQ